MAGDFDFVLRLVNVWLDNIEREQASPNLWTQLGEQRDLLTASEPSDRRYTTNAPLSPEEQARIRAQLNEIKELLVTEHGADPRALESRVEQLKEAAARLGRRDWLLMFMGVGLTWTLEGLIPPEGLREVLAVAAQGIGHLFGGVPQLPMP